MYRPLVWLGHVAVALIVSACMSNSMGHRDPNCDPDERLAGLLHVYADCQRGHCDEQEFDHVLVACDRVRNEIERLTLMFPRHVPILMGNAILALEDGEPEKAQRYLDTLLNIQPDHAEAAILRSRIAVGEGNLAAARRLLERQVQSAPDHAGLRETLSAVLYMDGQLDQARAALMIAERLGAPTGRVAYNRGLIAEAAGQPAEAERQYQAAADANPDFKPARARLAGMQAMGG